MEGLLRHNPLKKFTLREVLSLVRDCATPAEVNSILHKMVHDKGLAVVALAHNGTRHVNCYQWRLPSHGR